MEEDSLNLGEVLDSQEVGRPDRFGGGLDILLEMGKEEWDEDL